MHSSTALWPDVVQKAARALREFRIDGVATNIPFIQAVLAHPDFVANRVAPISSIHHVAALVGAAKEPARPLFFAGREGTGNATAAASIACRHRPVGSVPIRRHCKGRWSQSWLP